MKTINSHNQATADSVVAATQGRRGYGEREKEKKNKEKRKRRRKEMGKNGKKVRLVMDEREAGNV